LGVLGVLGAVAVVERRRFAGKLAP
jgi:hypothetical protein